MALERDLVQDWEQDPSVSASIRTPLIHWPQTSAELFQGAGMSHVSSENSPHYMSDNSDHRSDHRFEAASLG